MHPHEADEVVRAARAVKPPAAPLEAAVKAHPERVRVAHLGHEHAGAFVLTELDGGIEEISGLALTGVGSSAGAERAVVEYVVNAAKFGGKRAVEVVAPEGSSEARHLASEGFHPEGEAPKGLARYRIDLKPPKPAAAGSAQGVKKAKQR